MTKRTCSAVDCDKATRTGSADLCEAHYMKWYRYGTTEPRHPSRRRDIAGQRFGTLVAISYDGKAWFCQCDCGGTRLARINALLTIDYSYSAIHNRLKTDRGPASSHPCVDCGNKARHWSYDHTDENEHLGASGLSKGVAYSMDPDRYAPRCVPCHKTFDLAHIAATKVYG